ncbi:MAG: polysaccharide biosynthesis tyrosine autokinase [Bdellovibrionales bacterium]|nr:polysaccharide biosynthesis tyrosine autokinase [Bdellovibrionales bacterium]
MTEESASKMGKKKELLEDRKIAILTALEVLKTKKRFFIMTIVLTAFGTLLGHFLKVPTYETHSTLFVQNIDQPSAAEYLLNQHVYKLSRVDRIDSYVNHLKSDSFYLQIAEKIKFGESFELLNLTKPSKKSKLSLQYWKNKLADNDETEPEKNKLLTPIENIVGFLKSTISYTSDFNSQFVEINVKTLDARTSQIIANLIAEEFVDMTNRLSLDEVKEVQEFVSTKKKAAEDSVRELDQKLIRFKQKNNIVSADATTKSFADRLSNLESQIETANIQLAENEKLLSYFSKSRRTALNNMIQSGAQNNNMALDETSMILQTKLDQLRRKKSGYLAQGYPESSWQVQGINEDIAQAVARLKNVLAAPSREIASLDPIQAKEKIDELNDKNRVIQTRISTLKKARKELQNQLDLMPALQQEYVQLQNQFKLQVENLSNLERKEKELEIQRISHKKEVRVDQLAQLPGPTPRGNLFNKLLFSTFAAIFLGVLVVMGLESLDPTIKRRQDLYDCGIDFFGEIPFVENKKSKVKKNARFQFGSPEDLICKNQSESIESMSFKYMRARIESMRYKQKKDCQVITISSALHNEGKSFVAANLAISLAQLKRKVILVDADLRRPSQVAYFGLSAQAGLVDLLNMKKSLDEVLICDKDVNLDILPAGFCGMDSTELISSQKFRLLLEHLRKEYDYVVVDTPPTFAVVDAAIVSSFSDLPILVSSFRSTRKADLYEAYNDLLQVSYKKVFGVINKAIVSNSRIHYYGYPLYTTPANEVVASQTGNPEDEKAFIDKLNRKTS